MQKIYVLLRNDKQTGPYTLQELVQFDLKPYDLIWIEGKSAGWYYPQEIGALHPYLRFLPQKPKLVVQNTTAVKPVIVSPLPKAEPKDPAPATVAVTPVKQEFYQTSTADAKRLEEAVFAQFQEPAVRQEPMATTASAPAKKKSPAPGVVALISVLMVGGVFAASWMLNRHPADEDLVSTAAVAPVQNELPPAAVAAHDHTATTSSSPVKQKREYSKTLKKKTGKTTATTAPKTQPVTVATNNPTTDAGAENGGDATTENATVIRKEPAGNGANEPAAPQEKKKSLRDRILDIFRKKPDDQSTGDAKPAETTNGERRASRRQDDANLAEMVSIRLDIPNNWMMGIKGAKAILVNRSNEALAKTAVEIRYYNDDNELLQTKTITFGKVAGKGSKTASIPDHATATRLEYKVVSVEGDPAA